MAHEWLLKRWYAVVDDLIGGYSASTVDKPVSQHRSPDEFDVASFMDEETARHIVELHNRSLPHQYGGDCSKCHGRRCYGTDDPPSLRCV